MANVDFIDNVSICALSCPICYCCCCMVRKDVAVKIGHVDCVKVLIQAGANLETVNKVYFSFFSLFLSSG